MERQLELGAVPLAATEEVHLTDKMKYLCVKVDANGSIDQIKDKKQQAQCKKFLDNVSVYEIRELIYKYINVEDD